MLQVRGHLFKLLHEGLRTHVDLRDKLLVAGTLNEMRSVCTELKTAGWDQQRFHTPEARPAVSWYMRHRGPAGIAGWGDRSQEDGAQAKVKGGKAVGAKGSKVYVSSGLKAALSGGALKGGADSGGDGGVDGVDGEAREAARSAALEKRARKGRERRSRNRARGQSRKERKASVAPGAKAASLLGE